MNAGHTWIQERREFSLGSADDAFLQFNQTKIRETKGVVDIPRGILIVLVQRSGILPGQLAHATELDCGIDG